MNNPVFKPAMANIKELKPKRAVNCKRDWYFSENLAKKTILEMVTIPTGIFVMGSPANQGEESETPQHPVAIKSFLMSKYPVTQAQWQAIAALEPVKLPLAGNPSKFQGLSRPVERISWDEAVEFCHRLSRLCGKRYRLPSEAEWEYACRAKTRTILSFGDRHTQNLARERRFHSLANRYKETLPVGHIGIANNFGLYDMHGNVYQWCLDRWHDNYQEAPRDGSAWLAVGEEEQLRVIRGGFWQSYARCCRSAHREFCESDSRSSVVGFRVACEI
jgi:formylglycine-generating enzyme required for sulfatase activity